MDTVPKTCKRDEDPQLNSSLSILLLPSTNLVVICQQKVAVDSSHCSGLSVRSGKEANAGVVVGSCSSVVVVVGVAPLVRR